MADNDMKLMYQPFSSILNPGFWQQLTNIKLNQLKLSKEPVAILGSYSCNLSEKLPALASFDHCSFNLKVQSDNKASCSITGELICTNIMQEFLDCNKKEFLDHYGSEIWRSICDGQALIDPEKCLNKCRLLVFADLKKYKYTYWFSFPVVNYPKEAQFVQFEDGTSIAQKESSKFPSKSILDCFSEKNLEYIQNEYNKPNSQRTFSRAFFIIKQYSNISTGTEHVLVFPLTQYPQALQAQDNQTKITLYFAFSDPSHGSKYPGWPLRNYLSLIAVQFKLRCVNVIRIRKGLPTSKSKLELHHSMIIRVAYDLPENIPNTLPPITGWEKNESQQMAPKRVNLSGLLDPKKLAEDAVNLNLRLMKWRLLPSLDLDKIAETKCLVLGCGTLGCHIARGLLAWGVKNLSLVDNARVSYSNPVRQTLYTFDDCTKSNGVYKAEAAAASLKSIHPSVNVTPYVFSIPMPGHHVDDKEVEQTRIDISLLEKLIDSNDAVFLLMDTRESRWLPTVIAISKQKLVINAAIGFDTFLLQRYGIRDNSNSTSTNVPSNQLSSDKLGCYFCNDIVAPGDSTVDRTLDQQCTVSRPGVSMMVSAMAVELLASIVSSRLGPLTPAPVEYEIGNDLAESEDCGSELGIVPHSIRGNLSRYHIYLPTSPLFSKCAACSTPVIDAYKTRGYEFLQQVFNDPSYLEEVAGLKDLQNVSDNVLAWSSSDDDDVDAFGGDETIENDSKDIVLK